VAVDIHHRDEFKKGDQGETSGAKAVKECQPVLASACCKYGPNAETENGNDGNKDWFLHILQTWLVKQGGQHTLHNPNLRSQAKREQHAEEEARPDGRPRDLSEDISHDDEGEPRSLGRFVQLGLQGTILQPDVSMVPDDRIFKSVGKSLEEFWSETRQISFQVNVRLEFFWIKITE
jgi:hypothetical protein